MDNLNVNLVNSINIRNLKIITVNVNSIIHHQRRASLINMIKKEKPNIILLNETKLNAFHKIKILDYNIIRKDRTGNKTNGGIAILINKPIKYEIINLTSSNNNQILENLSIKIKLKNNNNLIVTSVYAPGRSHKLFEQEFIKLFQTLELDKSNNYYIIAGDLNAKHKAWKNNENNTRGNFLNNWIHENDIKYKIKLYGTDIPTFPRGKSYLDICLTDSRLNIKLNSNDELRAIPYDSDHNAVSIQISNPLESSWLIESVTQKHSKNYKKKQIGNYLEIR